MSDERPTRWQGPSGLTIERMAAFGAHSGSGYSVEISAPYDDSSYLLSPEQWADLVRAAAELGASFGEMP